MDMDMNMDATPAKCSMHMLWNWETINTCIVFRSWHVSSTATFVVSFFGIVLIGIIFELLNKLQRSYDISIARRLALAGAVGRTASADESDLHIGGHESVGSTIPLTHRTARALLYGVTVFLSLFIMLIFMTYNGYLIGAVVVGASLGHWLFNGEMEVDGVLTSKGMACH